MNASSTKLPITRTGKSSLRRPWFVPGVLLQDDDLNQVVDYGRDVIRLLLRSMLGCGVLCGFCVKATIECGKLRIVVERGVALGCDGDLIELPESRTVEIDTECDPKFPPCMWVVICRGDQKCAPRDVMCSPQDDADASTAYTRIREGYEIRVLEKQPEGYCMCAPDCPPGPSNQQEVKVDEIKKDTEPTCCDFIASPDDSCYTDHYNGACACECPCDCIVLAKLEIANSKDPTATVDHSVRRFIRPVLMKDPALNPRGPCAPQLSKDAVVDAAHQASGQKRKTSKSG